MERRLEGTENIKRKKTEFQRCFDQWQHDGISVLNAYGTAYSSISVLMTSA